MKQAILIAGPTASGKSALSIKLAKQYDGVVINADSMQVYRDLRIITARPSVEEEMMAPHKLYGVVDGAQAFSAMDWAKLAMNAVDEAWQDNRTPILVGGTGMYFRTLLDGMAHIPDVDPEIRTQVRAEAVEFGSAKLHAELMICDPMTAERLAQGDSQRISRAIEVYRSSGKPISEWQKETQAGPLQALDQSGNVKKVVLEWPREELYRRCDLRFDLMLEEGALEEVEALLSRNLSPVLPLMKSLGVPSLMKYLSGNISLDEAREESKTQTRRFAKRQMTWFRNQFNAWERIDAQYLESQMAKIFI
ncbi:tRNA (adenosine(37)-N6)-dimethylallyltransferase MiaA [Kordiimonas sp. SCSIO 12610]|uniref:tRNA (adenosine(37)-N6)-dimethylallyltransferase MiaA n=1 Tax=Kordiimonas sp. SCSIO 12610 TaxID=2829597 RepID=UPI0021087492|nr:tRNA (adenosine(37)-N6)-dimethylallyltransferase MiaA [Kordiimonas sp. SCSIO 12610]